MNTTAIEKPWYQQFWPWFLIILPGIVVVAAIATVIIAFKHADTLVHDDYYKQGLAINKRTEDFNHAKTIGLTAEISIESERVLVQLQAQKDDSFKETSNLQLLLKHPFDKHEDTSITLQHSGNNLFVGSLPVIKKGRWYLYLQPIEQRQWSLKSEVLWPFTSMQLAND